MSPLETYIREVRDIRRSGAAVEETAYYGTLNNLLDEVGKTLKPKIKCIIGVKNQGAGLPDGGFFTPEQLRKGVDVGDMFQQIPTRGAMEVKGTSEDVQKIAQTKQVRDYLERYGLVLVTNLRDFLLVGRGPDGGPIELERYTLAASEAEFWNEAQTPRKMADKHGERLTQYLSRVMQHAAPLVEPKDLAWFLASYARDAKARIEAAEDLDALNAVRAALEEALGLQFEGEKGAHFFRSTLVQTLFYGLFSAWVLWSKGSGAKSGERFNWRMAQWSLHVPMIRALYEQVSAPSKLGPLGLEQVMDWAGHALDRVARDEFFSKFQEEHAVQYFYEPFLEAFDPELRKDLGVWYTPPEIVQYMVERVDRVLREELDIADGLADPNVYILDPCCGTGAYLVETLRRIEKTLRAKGDDALIAHDIKQAMTSRVFGFEILPAPFVVAHLQLGLMLQNLGAPLSDEKNERAGVYLTNALTGWEPPKEPKNALAFQELVEEREAAEEVKRDKPILVILGNPPYNAFAGVSPKEEQGLVEPYKEGLISKWGIKKFNLDDLYIRFFRLAERRIAEATGKGIVCFISNHSWISDPSFVVMREHLLSSFDKFWIESMHGNRKISEYAPDGRTSETVFAIPGFSPGIQQGTAISLWVRTGRAYEHNNVRFRDDLNAAKAVERRKQLLDSLQDTAFDSHYESATPIPENRYSFRPENVSSCYREWPKIVDLCAVSPSNGLMEKRNGALIDVQHAELAARMMLYCDSSVDWHGYKAQATALTQPMGRFNPQLARSKMLDKEQFDRARIVRYALRPLDTRWCYYTSVRPVWNEPRPSLWAQCWEGNTFLLTRFSAAKSPEGSALSFVSALCDDHYLAPDAVAIPIRVKNGHRLERTDEASLFAAIGEKLDEDVAAANISPQGRAYLATLGIQNPDADAETAALIWMHALAIGYSPAFLEENADGIRRDWPRIPLPNSKDALLASADFGKQIAALLDTENDVVGVTLGSIQPELAKIGMATAVPGEKPDFDGDGLAVTAGWGHAGKGGVTMPGRGKLVERRCASEELVDGLGDSTLDVYLNNQVYWKNIPKRVWDYHIGGYQVIKKWLSYRERDLLGRPLKTEEAREVMNMARRIAAIILFEPQLDANYERIKADCYPWQE